jgi:hypothetical protein
MGGLAWHYLQYVLGLAALGHDVYYLEDSSEYGACYDPRSLAQSDDPSYGLAFAADAFDRLGFGERWAYYDLRTQDWSGPAAPRVAEICRTADIVLNVSALNPINDRLQRVPVRGMIDTDPAFTQILHLQDPERLAVARRHTAFFTFGESIPTGRSTVPSDGLPWQATRQPLVLDKWPVTPGPPDGPFSTVLFWNSYAPVEYAGRRYGMKSASFDPYVEIPRLTGSRFELAFGSRLRPSRLVRRGWHLREPFALTADPWTYQQFVQSSKAEFSVAKQGYVEGRTGWFSERSAGYLASGRPVVVEETGFSEEIGAVEGIVPFSSLEQAVEGVNRINMDYARLCRSARAAAELFDARTVLASLLDRALTTVSAVSPA